MPEIVECDLFWVSNLQQLRDMNPRQEFQKCIDCGALVFAEKTKEHTQFHEDVAQALLAPEDRYED